MTNRKNITLIGLHGAKQSGKDTLGEHIRAQHGFTTESFADPIRQMLTSLDPYVNGSTSLAALVSETGSWANAAASRVHRGEIDRLFVTFKAIVMDLFPDGDFSNDTIEHMLITLDPFLGGHATLGTVLEEAEGNWELAKKHRHFGHEVRGLMQRIGTEVMRETFSANVWVDLLAARVTAPRVVVTDVRFPNEAEFIRALGGIVVRITRTNQAFDANSAHASEAGLPDELVDVEVSNNGVDLHGYLTSAEQKIFG